MSQRIFLAFASAMLAAVPSFGADILSCADVRCPVGMSESKCTVVDKMFNAVGVVNLNTSTEGLKDLSWVKAVGAKKQNDTAGRAYDQTFYLGTPNDFDFGATVACALIFTNLDLQFGDGDPRGTQGTCPEAMTEECVSALVDRAKSFDRKGASGTEACYKLQNDFVDNLDSACADLIKGSDRWPRIQPEPLSGIGAPKPISDEQNKTSDCWPIIPKDNDLTLVKSFQKLGDFKAETVLKNYFGITPILTVFFPGDGDDGLVSETEAQLTCMKTIDLNTATNETKSPDDGGEDGDDNGAGRLGGSIAALWVGLMSVVLSTFL